MADLPDGDVGSQRDDDLAGEARAFRFGAQVLTHPSGHVRADAYGAANIVDEQTGRDGVTVAKKVDADRPATI
ncbi:hypothetical protein ODJ79_12610 [Actinoplanes sp. KI2]|uniref:hypothetical protein n=1 Tax=Actinoplanes sp. KI2 TaxID=2983315 RepID=UPI0021D5BFE0|nr:hypothetical protein [Actinoplanes sp. KI2]MCU7724561.1 hypothetical protein [Actinoplanes sp. KI2]